MAKQDMKGITRIDHPDRRTYGWYVRKQIGGKLYSKLFSDIAHGGKNKSLEAAKAFYRKLARELESGTKGTATEKASVLANPVKAKKAAPKKKAVKKAAPKKKAPARKTKKR